MRSGEKILSNKSCSYLGAIEYEQDFANKTFTSNPWLPQRLFTKLFNDCFLHILKSPVDGC
jgi:hypothetical protein